MRYLIQQRIETLADNAVMKDGKMEAAFTIDPVRYSHWDFDIGLGWPSDFWLAEASIEADDYKAAFSIFRREMGRVIPRISLLGQAYIDFLQQPLLIVKDGEQVGFLRYLRKKPAVGLMFLEQHRDALLRLLEEVSIPEEFYYYWNDVVNAVGYTPKLLLMCAAIECLTKTGHGKKDWEGLEGGSWFIKSKKSGRPSLKDLLLDLEKNGVNQLKDHECVHDDSLTTTY